MSLAFHEKLVYYSLIKSVPYAYMQWIYLRLHESSKIRPFFISEHLALQHFSILKTQFHQCINIVKSMWEHSHLHSVNGYTL